MELQTKPKIIMMFKINVIASGFISEAVADWRTRKATATAAAH